MQEDLDRVINWLLDYRKENPTFIFKGRTSPNEKLEESFWLNGNENYFFIKFSDRGTPNTFTTISYRFWFRNRDKNLMSDYDFFLSNTEFRRYINSLNQYRPGSRTQAGM